jgi:hypothetical protein
MLWTQKKAVEARQARAYRYIIAAQYGQKVKRCDGGISNICEQAFAEIAALLLKHETQKYHWYWNLLGNCESRRINSIIQ